MISKLGSNLGSRIRRRVRPERGAAAVEFAIVAPLLFILVFGIIDFGFGFHAWNAIENSAREGARLGATDSGPKVTDITARVQNGTSFLTGPVTTVVTCSGSNGTLPFTTCGPSASWQAGDLIKVTVTYDYNFMTPLPTMIGMGSKLHETAVAESRFEGN